MRVGIGLPNTIAGTGGDQLFSWIRRADNGPFSTLGVFDRVRYDSYEPLAVLAAAAGATTRVGLATMIVISPLRNTAMLAKSAASVDALSGGRLTLGVAVGARRDDYSSVGVPYGERGRRLTEQLAEMRAVWADPAIGPAAARPAGPNLLVGGNSDVAFSRVTRYADGYAHGGGPPRVFARMADKARAAWQATGRGGKPLIWGMGYFALGAENAAAGADYLRDYYAFTGPFGERIAQELLTTPQAIAQFLRGYADAGCDEVILFPTSADVSQPDRLADVIG